MINLMPHCKTDLGKRVEHGGVNDYVAAKQAELFFADKVVVRRFLGAFDHCAAVCLEVLRVYEGPDITRTKCIEEVLARSLEVFAFSRVRVLS